MQKFLFILLLLPIFTSLGHDAYMYYQVPEKGVRFSDLGALWDKYHKESHDQWKVKVEELGQTIAEMTPEELTQAPPPQGNAVTEGTYGESFTQTITRAGEKTEVPVVPEDNVQTRTTAVQHWFGFILEQKAALVFAVIALLAYLLNAMISPLFKEKEEMEKIQALKKKKKKGGGYSYSRK